MIHFSYCRLKIIIPSSALVAPCLHLITRMYLILIARTLNGNFTSHENLNSIVDNDRVYSKTITLSIKSESLMQKSWIFCTISNHIEILFFQFALLRCKNHSRDSMQTSQSWIINCGFEVMSTLEYTMSSRIHYASFQPWFPRAAWSVCYLKYATNPR